jgi:putative spermidine/putrescine transport system ATP-binding protein
VPDRSAPSSITVDHAVRQFGTFRALDDLSLHVNPGELVALLGPSGCGKTTLLRLIAGLDAPNAGRVLFDDMDVTHMPSGERSIGMVFQSHTLFPNLTVRANIRFPLDVRHVPRAQADRRVNDLLQLVQLVDQADRYPHQVSGGQAQRGALARALAPDPRVLLLDEPLSALDDVVRQRLRDEIRRVHDAVGTTTIYVTHDQSEALAIADRVALMSQGRIEQIGSPEDVYRAPASLFAASFVGNRNLLVLPVHDGLVRFGAAFQLAAPIGSGDRVTILVAPEDVVVLANGASGLPVSVISRTFHGAVTRLALQAINGDGPVTFYADVNSREALGIADQATVAVAIDPAAVSVFPFMPDDAVSQLPES